MMTDGLSVIRRVYGLGANEPQPGTEAEAAVLTQTRRALDALPAHSPSADALARVMARAADASDVDGLAAVRGACGLGPAQNSAEGALLAQSLRAMDSLPAYEPSAQTVQVTHAMAEEATFAAVRATQTGAMPDTPEAALLRQSVEALDALPVYSPDASGLAAVLAEAERMSNASVLAAFGEAEAPDSIEAALLRQSMEALDMLPAYSPSGDALAAVLARAQAASMPDGLAAWETDEPSQDVETETLRQSALALGSLPTYSPDASGLAAAFAEAERMSHAAVLAAFGEADAQDSVPADVLRQSARALDTLPTYAPSEAAVAAVLGAAVPAPAATPSRRQPAADRAARPAASPRRRTGLLAGLGTLAVAVIAAVVLLPFGGEAIAPAPEAAAFADLAPQSEPSAPEERAAESDEQAEPYAERLEGGGATPPPAPAPVFAQRQAPRGPSAGGVQPAPERRRVQTRDVAPARVEAEVDLAPASLPASPSDASALAPEWDAGDDVRLLSLRLRQLREQNAGLEWDEPAIAFGAASSEPSGTTPGVQAVREGPPPSAARVRTLPPDTTTRR